MLLKARREGAGTVYENAGQVCARSCGSLIEGLEIDCCGETRCGAHDARPLVSSYEKLPAAKRGTVCDAGSRCGLANALDQDATPSHNAVSMRSFHSFDDSLKRSFGKD